MRHPIDPKVDCVFKALLGAEENGNLLRHFLNAILGRELPAPITTVEILSPFNEREFPTDKLSVVDVKARDDQGQIYAVEIQLLTYPDLPARILYSWADLYSHQLERGHEYHLLRPTYVIWLLGEDLVRGDPGYGHRYRLRDDAGRCLIDHGGVYLFELKKFAVPRVDTEEQRWLKFFREGEDLDADHPPEWMQTAEMRQAMSTLKAFSEKDRAYDAYQARQNFIREQNAIQRYQRELEQTVEEGRAALEAARQAEETALRDKDAALAEIARLKALLRDQSPSANS